MAPVPEAVGLSLFGPRRQVFEVLEGLTWAARFCPPAWEPIRRSRRVLARIRESLRHLGVGPGRPAALLAPWRHLLEPGRWSWFGLGARGGQGRSGPCVHGPEGLVACGQDAWRQPFRGAERFERQASDGVQVRFVGHRIRGSLALGRNGTLLRLWGWVGPSANRAPDGPPNLLLEEVAQRFERLSVPGDLDALVAFWVRPERLARTLAQTLGSLGLAHPGLSGLEEVLEGSGLAVVRGGDAALVLAFRTKVAAGRFADRLRLLLSRDPRRRWRQIDWRYTKDSGLALTPDPSLLAQVGWEAPTLRVSLSARGRLVAAATDSALAEQALEWHVPLGPGKAAWAAAGLWWPQDILANPALEPIGRWLDRHVGGQVVAGLRCAAWWSRRIAFRVAGLDAGRAFLDAQVRLLPRGTAGRAYGKLLGVLHAGRMGELKPRLMDAARQGGPGALKALRWLSALEAPSWRRLVALWRAWQAARDMAGAEETLREIRRRLVAFLASMHRPGRPPVPEVHLAPLDGCGTERVCGWPVAVPRGPGCSRFGMKVFPGPKRSWRLVLYGEVRPGCGGERLAVTWKLLSTVSGLRPEGPMAWRRVPRGGERASQWRME